MALQASGSAISASGIRTEFGASGTSNSVRLGGYRVSQTVSGLTNMPLDNGIPQSGTIKFSDFYSKKLNVVVDYTSPTIVTKVTGRSDYDANNNKVVVIGGFRSRPANPAGTKVWIHTNGDIGSDVQSSTRSYASLLTGNWDSTTDLRVDIGPNGRVFGAGGDGGKGGNADGTSASDGLPGGSGTSALGVNTTVFVIVTNRGRLQCGGGGGGGGGGAWARHTFYKLSCGFSASYRISDAGGGGGGGGAGYPAGFGGLGGTTTEGDKGCDGSTSTSNGTAGDAGTLLNAGEGKPGGTANGFASNAYGGSGANGADTGSTASKGGNGTGTGTDGGDGKGGGQGGDSGYSIVVANSSSGVSITNTGTLVGDIVYSTLAT